jgi:exopolysaccharide biosynthesis protein
MRMWLAAAALCALTASAHAQFALTFSSDPHTGIHRETWTDTSIPARVRLMRVDLSSFEIALYATQQSDRGITTTAYSNLLSAAVAINGDSFAIAGYVPLGLALGAEPSSTPAAWSGTADDTTSAVFDFHLEPNINGGTHTSAEIIPPEVVVAPNQLPRGTQGVISGHPLLVRSGVVESQFDCNDQAAIACERAPRTALALSADQLTMWLAVVDGWQSSSIGLTDAELANFLVARGADMALALDSGSSSTLAVDGNLISSPSDGVERAVANHLGVVFQPRSGGELVGLVCDTKINPCNNPIDLATVTLDDGQSQQTNTNGVFDFQGITPRLVCATAKKSGYYPNKRCVYVSSGVQNYDSMALQPCPSGGCMLLPDAGMIDAPAAIPDASRLRDGGQRDGGNGQTGPGGGCCGAGRDRPDVLLCAFVAWFLTRRRGTTA